MCFLQAQGIVYLRPCRPDPSPAFASVQAFYKKPCQNNISTLTPLKFPVRLYEKTHAFLPATSSPIPSLPNQSSCCGVGNHYITMAFMQTEFSEGTTPSLAISFTSKSIASSSLQPLACPLEPCPYHPQDWTRLRLMRRTEPVIRIHRTGHSSSTNAPRFAPCGAGAVRR